MILTFRDRGSEDVFNGVDSKAARKVCPPDLQRRARSRLFLLDDADTIEDLRIPPGNQLEALKGDREGQFSIRINQRYRICFRWTEGGVRDAEIVDYHP
ncbi:type II toxin-antitoxin system RelE/ParE family toxin [Gemmatimonadota bacterium]